MAPVQMIALDLDGTLLEAGERIRPEVASELSRLSSLRGLKVAIATGRPLRDILRILERNGMGPEVGIPHALMADEREGFVLEGESYRPLDDWNERMRRAWEGLFPLARELMERFVRQLAGEGVRLEPFEEQGRWRERGAVVYLASSLEEAERARAHIERELTKLRSPPPLSCVRNHRLVAVRYARAGKGPTLRAIAEALKVEPSQVLAVGDSLNDLDMLDGRYGFRSACPANAEAIVKRHVLLNRGYVAFNRLGRGVLEIVERCVVGEMGP